MNMKAIITFRCRSDYARDRAIHATADEAEERDET
jgi:hypothetical protein